MSYFDDNDPDALAQVQAWWRESRPSRWQRFVRWHYFPTLCAFVGGMLSGILDVVLSITAFWLTLAISAMAGIIGACIGLLVQWKEARHATR